MCPCVNVRTWMQASTEARGRRFPRTGVIGGWEPSNMGVALLISETSFQPQPYNCKKIFFLKYQEGESRNAQCRAHTVGQMMMHAHSGRSQGNIISICGIQKIIVCSSQTSQWNEEVSELTSSLWLGTRSLGTSFDEVGRRGHRICLQLHFMKYKNYILSQISKYT